MKPTRREFMTASAAAGLLAHGAGATVSTVRAATARSAIFINLVGGPSQLDTFDPKPNAPSEIRGHFGAIRTKTPGLLLSELLPNLANRTDRFALLRGMRHDSPPIHEAGLQLNNTGHMFRDGPAWPNVGAVLGHLAGQRCGDLRSWCMLPDEGVDTGIAVSRGLDTGWLSNEDLAPVSIREPEAVRQFDFTSCCKAATGLVRAGHRFITINMFRTVFDAPSWDCHADRGSLACSLQDYRRTVAPSFDLAFSDLLDMLQDEGLLSSTLVVATGEFGRTPKLNANGGRDHWANCWTALIAGGGVNGGLAIGASDPHGAEPADRPTTPQELVATIYHALGVPIGSTIPGPNGAVEVYPGRPIVELF